MTRAITHRQLQTCRTCRNSYYWAPNPHQCPYCDLPPRLRRLREEAGGTACGPGCCGPPDAPGFVLCTCGAACGGTYSLVHEFLATHPLDGGDHHFTLVIPGVSEEGA